MEEQKRSLTPAEDALEHIVACRDKPFLEERHIDSFKGRLYLLISVCLFLLNGYLVLTDKRLV